MYFTPKFLYNKAMDDEKTLQTPQTPQTSETSHKGHIILLVAHDAMLGENLLDLLKSAGYRCHLVRDEKQCIDAIKEIKPELLLIDLAFPDVDGYKILETKKSEPTISAIPIIAISDKPKDFDSRRAVSLGVKNEDQIVSTTLTPQEIMDKVTMHFSSKEESEQKDDIDLDAIADVKPKSTVLNGKKILWVEDDKFFSNIFQKRLSGYGCFVTMAKNSDEAFASLAKSTPDVIVLDLVLPGMSGFDILKAIRDNHTMDKVPVLVLSNLNQATDVERVKILGAQKFLVKAAVSLNEIVNQIEALVK
jgi:DNA-binding response OmpR family regulator